MIITVWRLQRILITCLTLIGGLSAMVAVAQTAPKSSTATSGHLPQKITWLIVGDSLSAEYGLKRGTGWVALLEKRLAEKKANIAIQNASISGETTAGGRARIASLIAKHKPAVVVIELGGNDALRGLDLKATQANLNAIVTVSKASDAKVVLIGMRLPPNYGRSYGEQFEAVFKTFSQHNVSVMPYFFDGFGEDLAFFQADRIHPSEAAQARMLENVWPALGKMIR